MEIGVDQSPFAWRVGQRRGGSARRPEGIGEDPAAASPSSRATSARAPPHHRASDAPHASPVPRDQRRSASSRSGQHVDPRSHESAWWCPALRMSLQLTDEGADRCEVAWRQPPIDEPARLPAQQDAEPGLGDAQAPTPRRPAIRSGGDRRRDAQVGVLGEGGEPRHLGRDRALVVDPDAVEPQDIASGRGVDPEGRVVLVTECRESRVVDAEPMEHDAGNSSQSGGSPCRPEDA